ncbi:hypothetical protein HK096_008607 [Nowakowskiella sp. JEL0078]|nr:hypothetical protein HK096_008607 [Nowakowskiella sp. JEL0078]
MLYLKSEVAPYGVSPANRFEHKGCQGSNFQITMRVVSWVIAASLIVSVSAQSGCLAYNSSTICTPWEGFVFRATLKYNNTQDFDTYNRQLMENNTNYLKSWRDLYGCPNWDGTGLRYRFSVLCALSVDQAAFPSTWPGSAVYSYPSCKGSTNVITSLCKNTCMTTLNSLMAIFNNQNYCTASASITPEQAKSRNQTVSTYTTLCSHCPIAQSSADSVCFDGSTTPLEMKTCGFFTAAESKAYCKTTAGQSDTCCSTASTGPNVGAIVGGVIAALVVVALGVFGYIFYKRRRAADSNVDNMRYKPDANKFNIFALFGKKTEDIPMETDRSAKGFTIYGQQKSDPLQNYDTSNAKVYSYNNFPSQQQPQPSRYVESMYDPTNDYGGRDYAKSYYGNSATNPTSANGGFGNPSMTQPGQFDTQAKKGILKQSSTKAPEPTDFEQKKKNRQSAIPELDGQKVRVIAVYIANLEDEMGLNIGDIVVVEESFDDGWAVGFNTMTGKDGCFPMACCAPVIEMEKNTIPRDIRQRVVSLHYKDGVMM